MRKIFFNSKSKPTLIDIGQSSFYIGTFFLSTTLFLSGIFFLVSLIISFLKRPINIRSNKWNLSLLICFILLVISSIYVFFANDFSQLSQGQGEIQSWDKNTIWLNLFKWLLMFLSFAGFEIYLKRENQRLNVAKFLFMGCIPIIISCLIQRFFKIYGPFELINGLIIFYLKPIDIEVGVTGIFNNPNYTGIWLSSLMPFSFLIFKLNRLNFLKSAFIALTITSTIFTITDTYSRNSFLGIFIAAAIMFSMKTLFVALIVIFITLILGSVNIPFLNQFSLDFLPDKIFERLFETNYISKFQSPRIDIWDKAIKLISERPLIGWGAATFPILYLSRDGFFGAQHTHNMILEIAQIHGLPITFILTTFVSLLIYKTSKIIFNKSKRNFIAAIDRAWLATSLILVISHLTDITHYEGRISLLIWILLSGLKCIIDSYKSNNLTLKKI